MRRTTIGAIALAGIVAATGAWQLLHRGSKPAPGQPAATAAATDPDILRAPTNRPVTIAVDNVASSRSKVGAVHAAVRFLELDERLFPAVSPEAARAFSDSITSTGSRRRLGDRAETHQREVVAKGDLEGLTLRLAPISTRVRNYSTA